MKPLRFLAPAEQELLEAAAFYEAQARGLGMDFFSKVESAGTDILENPLRWPFVRSHIRRRLISRFPYAILYRADPEEVLVLAVMHLHRHPTYWVERH